MVCRVKLAFGKILVKRHLWIIWFQSRCWMHIKSWGKINFSLPMLNFLNLLLQFAINCIIPCEQSTICALKHDCNIFSFFLNDGLVWTFMLCKWEFCYQVLVYNIEISSKVIIILRVWCEWWWHHSPSEISQANERAREGVHVCGEFYNFTKKFYKKIHSLQYTKGDV